nr:hypothetical protein P5668_14895 [Bacillus subtilis]
MAWHPDLCGQHGTEHFAFEYVVRLGRNWRRVEHSRHSFVRFAFLCILLGTIHLLVLHHGMESIKRFEVWAGL